MTLARLLTVSRPALWINTLGVALTGLWLSGRLWNQDPRWWALLLYLSFPFNLLIYGVNDLYDQAEDAASSRKGGWQGARGAVRGLPAAILLSNLPFAALLPFMPPAASAVLLLCAALFVAYSLPPLRLKGRPPLDSWSNVAYALPALLPALLLGGHVPWRVFAVLAAYSVGKHAFDAVQDVSADRAAGTSTTATWLGPRGTAVYSLLWFLLAGALLWPLSRLSALALWLCCAGGLSGRLLRRPTERRAAQLYLLSVLSPWLVGSVGGAQLVYGLLRGGTP